MPYDILIGFSISFSVLFFWLGRRFASIPREADQLDRYMDYDAESRLRPATSEPSQFSFMVRVILPIWRGVLTRLGGLTPQHGVDTMAKRLDTAGRPYGLNVLNFLGLKFIVAPVFALALCFAWSCCGDRLRSACFSQQLLPSLDFIFRTFGWRRSSPGANGRSYARCLTRWI